MRLKFVAAAALALLTVACADEEIETGSIEQAYLSPNGLCWNRLSANWANSMTVLDRGKFVQTAATSAISSSWQGVSVLEHFAKSGLAPWQTVEIRDTTGNPHLYPGTFGFYTHWTVSAPPDPQLRWIISSIAADLNGKLDPAGNCMSVSISRRGPTSWYLPITAADLAYNGQEGAFYGRIVNHELEIHACYGAFTASQCGNTSAATLKDRLCARGDPRCGHVIIDGACDSVCSKYDASQGWFQGCKARNDGFIYDEVTTTWVDGNVPLKCSGG